MRKKTVTAFIIVILFLSMGTVLYPKAKAEENNQSNDSSNPIIRAQDPVNGTSYSNCISLKLKNQPLNGDVLIATVGAGSYNSTIGVTNIREDGVTWTPIDVYDIPSSQVVRPRLPLESYTCEIWLGTVGQEANQNITVILSNTAYYGASCDITEYQNINATAPLDTYGNAAIEDYGSTVPTGYTSKLTSQDNELWIGAIWTDGGQQSDPQNGFALIDGAQNVYDNSLSYLEKIVDSTNIAWSGTTVSNPSANANSTVNYVGIIAAFKGYGAAATSNAANGSTEAGFLGYPYYATSEGSWNVPGQEFYAIGSIFTLNTTASFASMTCLFSPYFQTNYQYAIYDFNDGKIGTLIAQTNQGLAQGNNGTGDSEWHTLTFPSPVNLTPGVYCLMMIYNEQEPIPYMVESVSINEYNAYPSSLNDAAQGNYMSIITSKLDSLTPPSTIDFQTLNIFQGLVFCIYATASNPQPTQPTNSSPTTTEPPNSNPETPQPAGDPQSRATESADNTIGSFTAADYAYGGLIALAACFIAFAAYAVKKGIFRRDNPS